VFCKILIFLSIFLVGCSNQTSPPKQTLRISFAIFPCTIDPRKSGDIVSSTLACLLYDGLTRCLPDGSSEPALAERIEVSADQKIYTFHLKQTFWSDGTLVTAHDFEKTWKQHLNPKFPSLCAYLFYPILNAEKAYHEIGSINDVGIKALDDLTLRVVLERPTPYFLSLTSFPSFLPVPQHCLSKVDSNEFTDKIFNGPFVLESATPNASLLLKKNPHYWNLENVFIEKIQVSVIPNEVTAFSLFERGELDWLGGVLSPISQDAFMAPENTKKVSYFPMSATTFCTFNTTTTPFSNKNIRKAFAHAIDRSIFANQVLLTKQVEAHRCIPPALCKGIDRNILPVYDPKLAKDFLEKGLEELGISKGNLGPITLSFRNGPTDKVVAQVIQRKWQEVLGVEVNLSQLDFNSLRGILHSRTYSVALTNWIAQYHDPLNIIERFKSPSNAKNYPGWDCLEFDQIVDNIQNELNLEIRNTYINYAEDLIVEELPILPIYHWKNPSLCHPRLRNMHTTPSGGVLFEKCYLADYEKNK
jgi:oligopeptide transport system substrate-binding protein